MGGAGGETGGTRAPELQDYTASMATAYAASPCGGGE